MNYNVILEMFREDCKKQAEIKLKRNLSDKEEFFIDSIKSASMYESLEMTISNSTPEELEKELNSGSARGNLY
jgi:hypothetical protein